MDQHGLQTARFFCQYARSAAIDRFSQLRLPLSIIHGSISSRIDDHIRPALLHFIAEAGYICHINFRVIEGCHNPKRLQAALQFPTKLAGAAQKH